MVDRTNAAELGDRRFAPLQRRGRGFARLPYPPDESGSMVGPRMQEIRMVEPEEFFASPTTSGSKAARAAFDLITSQHPEWNQYMIYFTDDSPQPAEQLHQ